MAMMIITEIWIFNKQFKDKQKGIRMTSYISNAPNTKKIKNGDGMSDRICI